MEPTATHMQAVPSHSRAEPSQRLRTTPSTPTASRTTPVAALTHALASTRAHHAAERSVSASQMSRDRRSSAERSCRCAQPRTVVSIEPKLPQAPTPAMLTARKQRKATKPCRSSLQMAATSGGSTRSVQTVERPHCCPATRALPPNARAHCRSIGATAASSFPASLKGGTRTCGSTAPTSRNVHPCGKGEPSERERSGAGAAGVQVHCSITTLHYPCSITTPCTLLLPHAVSSLMILRDRGDVSDSQKGIQTMPLSTSATFMVLMTTHLSEGLVRDVHAERHGVATVPPRAHRTRLPTRQQSTQLICVLNLRARMVQFQNCSVVSNSVIN
jgi:hypothetical protein